MEKPKLLCIVLLMTMGYLFNSVIVSCSPSYCFDWFGEYSTEVALSKPSIVYDLGILESVGNVSRVKTKEPFRVGKGFVYRSHVDTNLVVFVIETNIVKPRYRIGSSSEVCLSIRIEPITKSIVWSRYYASSITHSFYGRKVPVYLEGVLIELGWSIDGRDGEAKVVPKDSVFVRVYEKVVYRVHKPILGSRVNVSITIIRVLNETTNSTDSFINVTCIARGVVDKVVDEVSNLVYELFGIREDIVFKPIIVKTVSIDYIYKLKDAVVTELRWLRDLGVIKGLTEEDIHEIFELVYPGTVGSKAIVYSDRTGKWSYAYKAYTRFPEVAIPYSCYVVLNTSNLPQSPPNTTTITPAIEKIANVAVLASFIGACIILVILVFFKHLSKRLYREYIGG